MPGERRSPGQWLGSYWPVSAAIFIVVIDQITKLLIAEKADAGKTVPIVKNIFHLTLLYNRGAAFGIFKDGTYFFIIAGISAIIAIIFYLPRLMRAQPCLKIGIAAILGGSLGNLIDRLRLGHVVDFLDFRIWPVFNVADTAITIGSMLIIIELIKRKA